MKLNIGTFETLGAVHVYVDSGSAEGNVYVKCNSVAVAHKCVVALHGRFFSGKVCFQ